MAIGQPFMYNAPTKLTSNWFPKNERTLATMVGTQTNVFGVVLGFLFPRVFVDDYVRAEGGQPLNKSDFDYYEN